MSTTEGPLECPFCGFKSTDKDREYAMLLHMEAYHSEGKSPFVPDESLSDPESGHHDDGGGYVECPVEACNEVMVKDELDYHLELHAQEADQPALDSDAALDSEPPTNPLEARPGRSPPPEGGDRDSRTVESTSPGSARRTNAILAWRNILNMPSSKRRHSLNESPAGGDKKPKQLGVAQLGKYAHEQRMPDKLVALLRTGGQVVGEHIIPVLQQLLNQNSTTRYAYLCHPCVQHVSKLRREGGFCGYRNIQMLASYVNGTGYEGSHHFGGKLPSIFDIQEFVEAAWDRGINKQGRIETGGIRGTRKYIGTPEAQALFSSLGMPVEAQGFKHKESGKSEQLLLQTVEHYFSSGTFLQEHKVRATRLPPIYFQHAGHSMTIVGFEKLKNGEINLLVFDPMFRDAESVKRLVGMKFAHKNSDSLLKAYRRGHKYLKRYREFETLK